MILFLLLIGTIFGQTMNQSLIVGDRADLPKDSVFFVNSKKASILSRMTEADKLLLTPIEGMLIYNLDKFKYEYYKGTEWITLSHGLMNQWELGKDYVVGDFFNTGSDNNWLFKVIQNHTSSYVPQDLKDGKLLTISPPIISTGIQGGGQVTLVGNTATIQAGTGFIAKYGSSPSPYPLVTIVEWGQQDLILPSSGIYTLYINEDGVLISTTGATARAIVDEQDKISVGIIDMNLGKAYDRETYPSNPVGQVMGISLFFGGMTRGLNYTATGLQLNRTAYTDYFWGANSSDPYNPNTHDLPALSPVTFYEYTQSGPVLPVSQNTALRNNVYDLNGTLVPMGNNKWGFVKIYTTLGVDDYVMYSQKEYFTEADAKAGVISADFKKPVDLELTKFSSWLVFEKGDLDFSDNPITTCEPFGCDKIGTTGGGGGGGAGDVLGPVSSVANNFASFSDISGKVIKDSGISSTSLGDVKGPASSANTNLIMFSGTTGKQIAVLPNTSYVNNITTFSNQAEIRLTKSGTGTWPYLGLRSYSYPEITFQTSTGAVYLTASIPSANYALNLPTTAPQANQIIQSNSSGQLSWANMPTPTPPTVVEDSLTSTSAVNALSSGQGKILNDKVTPLQTISHTHANKSTLDVIKNTGTATEFLAGDGTYKIPVDTNTITVVENVLTSTSPTNALSANQGKILNDKITPLQTDSHSHANKPLLDSLTSTGLSTQFLSADGTYKVPVDNVGTGNVVGPTNATDNAIVRFDLATGKIIKNSGVLIDNSNNLSTTGTISAVGQIWSSQKERGNAFGFDFNDGNNQATNWDCGPNIGLSNMKDGGVYTILFRGAGSYTCSFTHSGLTFRYPPGHGPTVAGKHTLYSFVVHGSIAYVGWTPDL